jgi:hypothetical protein
VAADLAVSQQAGYRHWDDMAARMVDTQAPGLAGRLRDLASVPHSGPGWDGRLLEEYALLRPLAVAYRRQADRRTRHHGQHQESAPAEQIR